MQEKTHYAHEIPCFRGGGVFWVVGKGGVPILFLWARGFFLTLRLMQAQSGIKKRKPPEETEGQSHFAEVYGKTKSTVNGGLLELLLEPLEICSRRSDNRTIFCHNPRKRAGILVSGVLFRRRELTEPH